jgi:hypothetical protein
MSSPADIKKRLEQNWIHLLKANSAKLALDSIDGSSPPSVFVGSYGYPKVKIGPMISQAHGDTAILDKTELWTGKSFEQIVDYRLSLVRGTFPVNVYETNGRYLENLQELAMSERPAESEATFERNLLVGIELEKEMSLNTEVAPFGPSAPLKTFKASALSADQRIESAYYDTDLRTADAVMELYRHNVPVSNIHRVLSVGMLGQKKRRKIVPTRWSISATDDTISSRLVKTNETNPSIDLFEVTWYSHLANYYYVILIPYDVWSFEMIESWFTNNGQIVTEADYEDASGIDHYPNIAGAYFAARLAVAERLAEKRQKAAALVLREIHPEYVMPLGVWQIREAIREALKKSPQKFETLDAALTFATASLSMSKQEIFEKSRLWQTFSSQTRITDFA